MRKTIYATTLCMLFACWMDASQASIVRSSNAASQTNTEKASMPTAADYIQDGLVGLWDAIENAGWGIHDPNATTWTDLTGFQTNCVVNGSNYEWRNNILANKTCTSTYGFSGSVSFTINSPIKYMAAILSSKACTIEFVFIPGFNLTGSSLYGPQLYDGSSCYLYYQSFSSESYSGISDGYGFFRSIHTSKEHPFTFKGYRDPVSYAGPCSLSMRGFYADERWWGQVIRNGQPYTEQTGTAVVKANGSINATADDGYFTNMMVFPSNRNPSKCGINCYAGAYCYRIYSRSLTEEEVMHNYKIDRKRFGL